MSQTPSKTMGEFAYDFQKEVFRARAKFPGNKNCLAALMEEVGELAKALLDEEGTARVYEEAVQVAAMAARVATEGDASFEAPSTDAP